MDVDAAMQSQIRNIEATYGKPLDHWFAVIDASGLAKHNQVVAMLKADHGLAHGAAHRVSLLSRQRHDAGVTQAPDPAAFLSLFTHRVRITAATDLDDELRGWLATAYVRAG
jgi:Domain of unknown function (DUF4287)